MKILIFVFSLSILIVQSSEAQYKKLTLGQPVPFDTAVAIQIKTYRTESVYIETFKTYVDSLKKELDLMRLETTASNNALRAGQFTGVILQQSHARQDSLIERLSRDNSTFYKAATKPVMWYEKKENWGLGGILLGIIIHSLFR